jgi:hypothetical protein
MESPTRVNIKGGEVWKCPEHGATCNPGNCKARADLEYMRRKDKEHEERLEAKRKREEKWKKAAEKRERKAAQAEGREVSHDLPPHLAGRRYRGAGGSDSDNDSSELSGALMVETPTPGLTKSHRFAHWLWEPLTSSHFSTRCSRSRRLGQRRILVGRRRQRAS